MLPTPVLAVLVNTTSEATTPIFLAQNNPTIILPSSCCERTERSLYSLEAVLVPSLTVAIYLSLVFQEYMYTYFQLLA